MQRKMCVACESLSMCFIICTINLCYLHTNSQRSNLLNQARLTTLKAQDDHVKVSNTVYVVCVCVCTC